MKRILALVFFVSALAFAGSAQLKFGAGGTLLDGSFGIQGKAHNTFSEDFAGQATFNYFFESGVTLWGLDFDVHYSGFDLGDVENFRLSPFAGLNILRASAGGFSSGTTNLNIGINGTMPLTDTMDLYVEPKFVLGDGSGFGLSVGVYF